MRLSVMTLCAAALAAGAQAQAAEPGCPISFRAMLSNKVFDNYAVALPARIVRPAAADVRRGDAHLYRSVIRDAAKDGPNFAGHYTLIRIGCGAATACVAIADAQTGRIYFPPEMRSASALLIDTLDTNVDALNFRRNSRLLVLIGSANEEEKKAGISYYLWHSGRLSLLRTIPAATLCTRSPGSRSRR